ncbi:hypothetical protein IKG02_02700 [Candidatus Saccharibacteria bacterium]|nr:hypothetical protein [Candidatus Saccharibacteria bacterium]
MDNNPDSEKVNLSSSASHLRTQKSTTLNRKYVKRPESGEKVAIDSLAKRRADDLRRRQALAEKINRERLSALRSGKSLSSAKVPVAVEKAASVPAPSPEPPKPLSATIEKNLVAPAPKSESAKPVADSAIQSAMKSVSSLESSSKTVVSDSISTRGKLGAKRIALALACSVVAVGLIGYFVSTNTPDLSVRVAAMQSGIEASYPSYVPRGYSLSDIVSKEGELEMTFTNSEGASFILSEEKSAWDNNTLESNYVKQTWNNNYTSIREQGITIFISGSDASWVNGGILYKLNSSGNALTKKQIKSIVTSL